MAQVSLNDCFDHIYCLTLTRRPERWKKVKQEFKKLNIEVERFPAIDGNSLSEGKIKKYPIINKYAIGCMLSHYKIIEDAKKHKYKNILIFEDDVIFHKNFVEEFSNQIKKIKNWKILYLGATQTYWDNIEYENGFYYSLGTLGTFAIGINESIYEEVLALTKFNAAIDTKYINLQHKHYKECYTFYPNLVIADVSDSDIRGHRDEESFRKMARWDGSLYDTEIKQLKENSQIHTKQEYTKYSHCGKEFIYINKKKEPISIIIPAYEAQDFIEECLDSIQNQTYFQNFDDYEILIGVDGCEKTLEKLLEIKENYKNLKVFMMDSNMGAYVTINTLVSISKYENFIIFGSDDIMLSELIEESSKYFGEYDIVRWWYHNYKNNTIISVANRGANGALFLKKSTFNKMGGYRDWKCAADLEFLQRASTISKQFIIEKPLMLYRIHNKSLTNINGTSMKSELRKEYHKKISNKFEQITCKTNSFKNHICINLYEKKDSKPKLSVALPIYNGKKIAWLSIESLCNQCDVNFEWELIICEENYKDSIGLDIINCYKDKLKQNGCVRIIYISLFCKILLAKKWQIIGNYISNSSMIFLLQAADCYSPSLRFKMTYDKIINNNIDWYDFKKGYFYSFISKRIVLYDYDGKTNLNMSFNAKFAKNIPDTLLEKGIDYFLLQHCISQKQNLNIYHDNLLLNDSVDTHGLNNISLQRENFFDSKLNIFKKTNLKLNDLILEKHIINKLNKI